MLKRSCLLFLVISILILGGCKDYDSIEIQTDASSHESESIQLETQEPQIIYVYVCGAVENPGVYAMPMGSRADYALYLAGGFREDAKTDEVNLAKVVSDGEKISFPTMEEANQTQTNTQSKKVNINTADETLLCTLTGIGSGRAKDIIRYREKNGLFQSIEDLMKVSGIKESVFEKIKEDITTGF